jgi:hypothetical protein
MVSSAVDLPATPVPTVHPSDCPPAARRRVERVEQERRQPTGSYRLSRELRGLRLRRGPGSEHASSAARRTRADPRWAGLDLCDQIVRSADPLHHGAQQQSPHRAQVAQPPAAVDDRPQRHRVVRVAPTPGLGSPGRLVHHDVGRAHRPRARRDEHLDHRLGGHVRQLERPAGHQPGDDALVSRVAPRRRYQLRVRGRLRRGEVDRRCQPSPGAAPHEPVPEVAIEPALSRVPRVMSPLATSARAAGSDVFGMSATQGRREPRRQPPSSVCGRRPFADHPQHRRAQLTRMAATTGILRMISGGRAGDGRC